MRRSRAITSEDTAITRRAGRSWVDERWEIAISAITLTELAAAPHATSDPTERARRQDRLQRAEATFDPLPVDADVARAFGRIYAAVAKVGRKAHGRRAFDLMIAATAVGAALPLYTRNPEDFAGLSDLLEVVAI